MPVCQPAGERVALFITVPLKPSRRSVLGLVDAGPRVAGRVPSELEPGGEYDRFIAESAARNEFSGTVLLIHRGKTVLSRSHGMANAELSVPNGPDTIFSVGSITKMFTGIAICQLAQQDKVALGATIGTYLDGFPAEIADTVTIHQLLTHTSGVGRPANPDEGGPIPGREEWESLEEVLAGYLDFVRGLPLRFEPGSDYDYSNDTYVLLAAIVAQMSEEKSYYDNVRNHIFVPAGMTSTLFPTAAEWRDNRRIARPYARNDAGEWVDEIDYSCFVLGWPAGGAFATAADLVRFANALQSDDLLDPAFTHLATSPKHPNDSPRLTGYVGYAAGEYLVNDQWVLGHNGGAKGIGANLDWFPDTDWQTVVLRNHGFDIPKFQDFQDLVDIPRNHITT